MGILPWEAGRTNRPKFEARKEFMMAYIQHTGPYDQVPWEEYMGRLYGWAKEQKVMPGFHPMGIYYDDPIAVPREHCRSDIAITYKGEAKGGRGIKTRMMPAMRVAALSFKGPGSEIGNTYAQLSDWIRSKGYRINGPSIEVYSKKPEIIDGVTILYSKIIMPVEPG
jgi:effector-binding domain-containing protein